MKVSELIMALKNHLTTHGDEEVVIMSMRHGDWDQYPVRLLLRTKDEVEYKPGDFVVLLLDGDSRQFRFSEAPNIFKADIYSIGGCSAVGCDNTATGRWDGKGYCPVHIKEAGGL